MCVRILRGFLADNTHGYHLVNHSDGFCLEIGALALLTSKVILNIVGHAVPVTFPSVAFISRLSCLPRFLPSLVQLSISSDSTLSLLSACPPYFILKVFSCHSSRYTFTAGPGLLSRRLVSLHREPAFPATQPWPVPTPPDGTATHPLSASCRVTQNVAAVGALYKSSLSD